MLSLERKRTDLGEFLRLQRERSGLTQDELSEQSGISRNTISAIELGRVRIPSPGVIKALAAPLRTPVREFVRAIGYAIEDDANALSTAEDRVLDDIARYMERLRSRGSIREDGERGS